MSGTLKMTIYTYFRRIDFLLPLLVMLIWINYGFQNTYRLNIAGPLSIISELLPLAIIGVPYFAFVAYELTSRAQRIGMTETMQSKRGAERKFLTAVFVTLLIPLAVWSASPLYWAIRNYQDHGRGYYPFLVHSLLAVLLYWAGPATVGILLGLALSRSARALAFGVIFISAFLSSHFPMRIFATVRFGLFVPADFLDWFRLTIPISNEWPDSVYGIPMETSRWVLIAFWLLVLALIVVFQRRVHRRRNWRIAVILLSFFVLLSFARFAYRSHDSMNIRDLRPSSPVMEDYQYYLKHNPVAPMPATFEIESYNIDLKIGSRIKAAVTMKVADTDERSFDFTLYHGLKIRSIEDEQGRPLAFVRDRDIVTVKATDPITSMTMNYDGHVSKFFSNYQGITLPAYIAYYPLPGQWPLWDSDRSSVMVQIPENKSYFKVSINSPLHVYSNLMTTENEQTFEGSAYGVSLFAGMLTETMHQGTRYVHSAIFEQPLRIDANQADLMWQSLVERTGTHEQYSIHGKSIFYQAPSIAFFASKNERTVDLGDHIIALDHMPTLEATIEDAFMWHIPYDPDTYILYDVFRNNLFTSSFEKFNNKPDYELMQLIKDGDPSLQEGGQGDMTEVNIEAWEKYTFAMQMYRELFLYQCNTLGINPVFRATYQYLTAEDRSKHPVDFLYNLDVEDTP